MRSAISILRYSLFAISALYPTGLLICTCFQYDFFLGNITAFAVLIAILSVTDVVCGFISNELSEDRTSIILSSLMLPLALINTVLYPLKHSTFLVLICVTVALGSALYLIIKPKKRLWIRIVTLSVSVILALSIGAFTGLLMLFGNIANTSVVQTAKSPSGEYRAKVLDVSHGATGGNTVVYVYETDTHFNLFIFTISKKPATVYVGDWGESEDMQLHWKDDHCLVINNTEYVIS